MSIASDSLSNGLKYRVKAAEKDARSIAKEHGVKVRKNTISGIDVQYPSGEKKHYYGWFQLRDELVKAYDLAD